MSKCLKKGSLQQPLLLGKSHGLLFYMLESELSIATFYSCNTDDLIDFFFT